jgi:hypothetical protein
VLDIPRGSLIIDGDRETPSTGFAKVDVESSNLFSRKRRARAGRVRRHGAQLNVVIDAFNAGAAAATAVRKSLAKKDTKASSFYTQQARSLREQTD